MAKDAHPAGTSLPRLSLAGGTRGWPNTLAPYDVGLLCEDVWPTLFFFTADRLEHVRAKLERQAWARSGVATMQHEAEQILAAPPQLPIGRIGWRHDFYSHLTAEHLHFDPARPHGHVDPTDQSEHDNEALQRAWRLLVHERTYRLMRSLGLLYRLTGERRYAEWVAAGFRAAVDMFERDDLRQGHRDEALYFQPLYDAQVLALLADSYDLTRSSDAFSDAEHERIRNLIFTRGTEYQFRFFDAHAAHNMTCYVATAIYAAGRILDNAEWRRRALHDPKAGFFAMLSSGFPRDAAGEIDGFWHEGTVFYHWYSLCPLALLTEASVDEPGYTLARATLIRMLDSVVAMADDQLRVPPFGDLGAPRVMRLSLYRHVFEYAAGRLNPERFTPILAQLYRDGARRGHLSALAFGPDQLPEPPATPVPALLPQRTTVLNASGFAFLRQSTAEGPFQVFVRAGRYGRGHDHPDRLAIGLNAGGEVVTGDLGTAGYALKAFTNYCRSTLAHNTMLVDESNQSSGDGATLAVDDDGQGCISVLRGAYEGVTLTRRIRLEAPLIRLDDRFESNEERRFAWVMHFHGGLVLGRASGAAVTVENPSDWPELPTDGIWAFLQNRRTQWANGRVWADVRISERVQSRLWLQPDGPYEITVATSPGNPMPERRSTLIVRRPGKACRIRAVIEIYREAPSLIASPF